MHRRQFLKQTGLIGICSPFMNWLPYSKHGQFISVTGPIDTKNLGFILTHEHLLVDFIGAEKVSPNRYNRTEVIEVMQPYLVAAQKAGCTAFFDCTPQYLGRDVKLLQQLSRSTGLPIITNTGLYSANGNKYIPEYAFNSTAEELAAKWIGEFQEGIEGTGIKPGFIKISVDQHPLTEINKKIVQAAALTHKATGLTIASHTGSGTAALEQIQILKEEGVRPAAFVWVHAQNEKDRQYYLKVAKLGAWVEFDGLGWQPVNEYLSMIQFMSDQKMLPQVLISQDAGWYNVGEERGGKKQPFTIVFEDLIPKLKETGFTEQQLQQLFHFNPIAAFAIRKKVI